MAVAGNALEYGTLCAHMSCIRWLQHRDGCKAAGVRPLVHACAGCEALVTEGARLQSRPFPKAAATAAAARAAADCNNQQTIPHHTVWYYTIIP
jgi:hypothetical protein